MNISLYEMWARWGSKPTWQMRKRVVAAVLRKCSRHASERCRALVRKEVRLKQLTRTRRQPVASTDAIRSGAAYVQRSQLGLQLSSIRCVSSRYRGSSPIEVVDNRGTSLSTSTPEGTARPEHAKWNHANHEHPRFNSCDNWKISRTKNSIYG